MSPLVQVRDLTVRFSRWWPRGSTLAVDAVDLQVDAGESVGLVGESGCGKSTLVAAIVGRTPPTVGSVALLGHPVRHPVGHPRGPRPEDVQVIFQSVDAHIDPAWTPDALLHETAARFGRSPSAVEAVLDRVGLSHRRAVPAGRLSGGERRRLGVARVLLVRPRLILADEPCAGVDAGRRTDLVRALQEDRPEGAALLLVSHDLRLIRATCARVSVMLGGRIVETCDTRHLGHLDHHPYTDTLLRAAGLRDGPVPPHQARPGRGCSLHHCCAAATPACGAEVPRLQPHASSTRHSIACLHPVPGQTPSP